MASYKEKYGKYEVRSTEAGSRWFKGLAKAEQYYKELFEGLSEDLSDIGETDEIELVDLKTGRVIRSDKIGEE